LREKEIRVGILDYFDRLAIIHLPEREDRFRALRRELASIGIDLNDPKVSIPDPPMPESAHGYVSRGVYGSFLSHLDILETAYRDGLETVFVLEDDAIFSKKFRKQQSTVCRHLRENPWDFCFIGHSWDPSFPNSPTSLMRYSGPFIWAHAYAVHRRIMARWIDYLHQTTEREVGHPKGGKVYIDAAQFLFRQFNPDVICIVSSPCLSVQKGSPSSLNDQKWFKRFPFKIAVDAGRVLRDEAWREGWLRIDGPKELRPSASIMTSGPAEPWPPLSSSSRQTASC
jgi:glycosyl transferase family 25